MVYNIARTHRAFFWKGLCHTETAKQARSKFDNWSKLQQRVISKVLSHFYTTMFAHFSKQGQVDMRMADLFGGCLCVRRAWEQLASAAKNLWGLELKGCIKYVVSWFVILSAQHLWHLWVHEPTILSLGGQQQGMHQTQHS